MAPTATSLAAVAGGITFCAAILGVALLIFSKARASDLLAPVAVGCALRLGVMIAAHLGSVHTGDRGFMFLDDSGYLNRGALLAIAWGHGDVVNPAAYQYSGTYQFGFYALVASVVVLIGKSVLGVKLVNVLLGTATVLLLALLAERVLGKAARRRAGWLAALMPGLIWWSAPMLKEAPATFLSIGILLAAVSLPKRTAAIALPVLLMAAAVTRTVVAVSALAGIAVAYVLAAHRVGGHGWRIVGRAAAALAALVLVATAVISAGNPHALFLSYKTTVGAMVDIYRNHGLTLLPTDVAKSLVTPIPWAFDVGTRNWDRGLYPGMWAWYCFYPLAALGAWRLRRRPELALVGIPIVVTLALDAYTSGFVFRQRSTVEPLILVLAIAGMKSWSQAGRYAAGALGVVAVVAGIQSRSPVTAGTIALLAAAVAVASARLRSRTFPPITASSALVDALAWTPVPSAAGVAKALGRWRQALIRAAPSVPVDTGRQTALGRRGGGPNPVRSLGSFARRRIGTGTPRDSAQTPGTSRPEPKGSPGPDA
jgi:hypothetical protein